MSYQVLARKWRPQTFDEVVGQAHVIETLKNAIAQQRVAHAYLFVGPRGTGKTTTARLLAKALNCREGPTATPCNACDSCRAIAGGQGLDVIEIDGASNTGVDQVRDLRENILFTPAHGTYRIYIIDEVHMLSAGAFNALLKTLEEPPAHVKFLFATTEPHKLPATFLSRCQRFDLRPIATRLLVEHLARIAREEKVEADEDALLAIARGAEGGLRDAISALDQLISFRGRKLNEEDVMAVFGLAPRAVLETLANAMLTGDSRQALALVAQLDGSGKDLHRTVTELIGYFRDLLVVVCCGDTPEAQEWFAGRIEALRAQAGRTDAERLLRMLDLLIENEQSFRYSLSRRTLFDVLVVRAAWAARVVSLDDLLRRIEALGSAPGSLASAPVPADPAPPRPAAPPRPTPPPQAPPPAQGPEAVRKLIEQWHAIVEQTGKAAPLARSALVDAKPVAVTANEVHVAFDPEFSEQHERMQHPRSRKALEAALRRLLGRAVNVRFSVLSRRERLPRDGAGAEGNEEATGESKEEPRNVKRNMSPEARQRWMQDENVHRVLEAFNGDIVDIRE